MTESWMIDELAHAGPEHLDAAYAEHIRTEFSTYRWLLEPMLAATGFEIVTSEFQRRLYAPTPVSGRRPGQFRVA